MSNIHVILSNDDFRCSPPDSLFYKNTRVDDIKHPNMNFFGRTVFKSLEFEHIS